MNLDFLQQLCGKWPGVTTDVKWGNDYVFSVAEKMFCVTSLEPPSKIAFKVRDEEFEEMSARDGFMPAPYMARNKWVLVTSPGKLSKNEWEQYVKQSYELVKSKLPKKTQETLGKAQVTPRPGAASKSASGGDARPKPREVGKGKAKEGRKKTQRGKVKK